MEWSTITFHENAVRFDKFYFEKKKKYDNEYSTEQQTIRLKNESKNFSPNSHIFYP